MAEGSQFHKGIREVPQPTKPLTEYYRAAITAYAAAAGIALFVTVISLLAVRSPAAAGVSVTLGLITTFIAAAKAIGSWNKVRPLRYDVHITAEVPAAFGDNSAFREAFAKGGLPVYRSGLQLLQGVLKRRFHGRIGYGGVTSTDATRKILGSWPLYIMLVLATLGLGAAGFAADFTWESIVGLLLAFALAYIIGQWLNEQYNSILKLFPPIPPSTDADETLGTVEGAGDPFVLKSEIEQRMRAFRTNNLPNNVHAPGWQVPVVTLNDSGRVEGEMVIETHPVHVTASPNEEWKAYADRSKFLTLASVVAPLFLLSFLGPLVPIAGFVAFLTLMSASSRSMAIAETVLQFYRWRSHVVFVELEGSVGRTEIRAGRGTTDSFESRNSVIRSDCQIRIWAATVTTETQDVGFNARYIMSLEKTPESQQMLQTVIAAVRDFETAGVKTRNIDLTHQGISAIAQANINVEGHKAQARGDAAIQIGGGAATAAPRLGYGTPGPAPALTSGTPSPGFGTPPPAPSATGFGAPPTPQPAWAAAAPPPAAAQHSMDHIQKAGRTLRLRCPKCSMLNTYAPNDYIQCRNCGLAKTKGE